MIPLQQRLYFGAPLWLQNALISAYGLKLLRLRYGSLNRKILGELVESQWLDANAIRLRQLAALNDVVQHAKLTVPFYRDRLGGVSELKGLDELAGLPLTTKSDIRAAGRAVVSHRFAGRSLEEVHTGGTTGTPLTVYCDRQTLQRNFAFFARFKTWMGVTGSQRVAVFAGRPIVPPDQTAPPFWRENLFARSRLFSSYHIGKNSVGAYADALTAFKPVLIDSYPSSIEPIARWLLDQGVTTIRPRAVITSSETLHAPARELMERAFGCKVFDHYGAAEMAAFISQCEQGTYHVNPEFGIAEVITNDRPAAPGETGELVVTGFINPVMPLIRYTTGDLAVQGADGCRCGRAFPTVAAIIGRLDDVITTPDGRRVGRLDPIFKAVASLVECRIVQDAIDHVRVEMVVKGEFPEQERQRLRGELALRLGPTMRVSFAEVAQIPRSGSGKLRTVVNLIDPAAHASAPSVN